MVKTRRREGLDSATDTEEGQLTPPQDSASESEWASWVESVGDQRLSESVLRTAVSGKGVQLHDTECVNTRVVHGKLFKSPSLGPRAAQALVALYERTPAVPSPVVTTTTSVTRTTRALPEPTGVQPESITAQTVTGSGYVSWMLGERRCPLSPAVRAILAPYLDAIAEELSLLVPEIMTGDPLGTLWAQSHAKREKLTKIAYLLDHGVLTGNEPRLTEDRRTILEAIHRSGAGENSLYGQRLLVHATASGLNHEDRADIAGIAHLSLASPNTRGTIAIRHASSIIVTGRRWPEMRPATVALFLEGLSWSTGGTVYDFACVPALVSHPVSRVAILSVARNMSERLMSKCLEKIITTVSPSPGEATNALIAELPDGFLNRAGCVATVLGLLSREQLDGIDRATRARLLQVPNREDRLAVIRSLSRGSHPAETARLALETAHQSTRNMRHTARTRGEQRESQGESQDES